MFNSQFLRQWFLQHGYTLYSAWKKEEDTSYRGFIPQLLYDNCPCFPHAFSGGDDMVDESDIVIRFYPRLITPLIDRVIFAQDKQKRHVAIKIVNAGSQEYDILRFIHEQGIPESIEKFNHVIPVFDMLPFGEFWFVAMPRWGTNFCRPVGPMLKEVFDVIRGSLKGLVFLHKNHIAHGEISSTNILVNHFGCYYNDYQNPDWQVMRQQGRLTYGILDFELSIKFPSFYSDEQCRLPYRMSWKGTPGYTPLDTCQGEFDFDPFA